MHDAEVMTIRQRTCIDKTLCAAMVSVENGVDEKAADVLLFSYFVERC